MDVWRAMTAHLRKGRSGSDDGASAAVASYAVAAAIFVVGSVYLLNFTASPTSVTDLDAADLRSKAQNAIDILVNTPGYPSDWDDVDVDNVQRLGLLEAGATVRVDALKFEALARGKLMDPSSSNSFVDYVEARRALGLEGYDFHIRASPVFRESLFSAYGVEGMDDYKVAYIGDHTAGLIPSAAASLEAAYLAALDVDFENALRTTALGTGSVFPDDKNILRDALLPLLGNGVPQSIISQGSGIPKYDFARVNETVQATAASGEVGLSDALALTSNGALGYTKSREIRAFFGSANFSTIGVTATIAWREFIDTDDLGASARDGGDYGFIEASPDGGATWYPINNDATQRSQDSPTAAASNTAFASRVATISASNCAPCLGANSVQIAFHWVADSDNNIGMGWIIDDVLIAGTGFLKTFEDPEFDLLIIGSNIDQSAMAANEIKEGIRDYVVDYGGRIVVLGGEQNTNWLQPIFHVGIRDGAGTVAAPDSTHPLLNTPNELDYESYWHDNKSWDFTGGDDDDLFNMVVGRGDDGHVLTASRATAFSAGGKDGVVMLTTYLPYMMETEEAFKFFANTITYGRYHYLYMEVGPEVPDTATVATASRTATMEKIREESGNYVEMGFIFYLWSGDHTTGRATMVSTPTSPNRLTATAGQGMVALSWEAPTNTPSPISGYAIYRGTASGATSLYTGVGPSTLSFVDTAVVNGVTYYYNVTAWNQNGQGYSSAIVRATPATVPNAPGTPSVIGARAENVLSWSPPTGQGGSAITGYYLYGSNASGSFPLLADMGNVLTYRHTGLQPADTWTYKISAVNAIGEGALSSAASGTTLSVPSAPTLTVTPGWYALNLTWSASVPTTTGHLVYRGTTSSSLALIANLTSGTNASFADLTIQAGQTRYYAVVPYNDVGNGSTSNVASGTAFGPPGTTVLAVTPGLESLNLTWSPASGSPTGYVVYRGATSTSLVLIANLTSSANVSFNDLEVDKGQTRHYVVVPYNAHGAAAASNVASGTALGVPSSPGVLALTRVAGGVTLNISASTDLWGAPGILTYKVYRGTLPTALTYLATATYATNPQTYEDLTAEPLTTYHYTVRAVTIAGEGDASNVASAVGG